MWVRCVCIEIRELRDENKLPPTYAFKEISWEDITLHLHDIFCGIWMYSMHDILTETMNHSDPQIKQKRLWERQERGQENCARRHSKHVLTELWCFVFGFAPIWIRCEEFRPVWECVWLVWAVPTCIQPTRV